MRSVGTRLGFAWTPKRPDTESTTQFARENDALVTRLATAIHDSATSPLAACTGTCITTLAGASFNEGWRDFSTWSAPALEIASPPVTATEGTPVGPLTVRLSLVGIARPDTQPVTVTLTSSSATGTFATSANGPFTPTLTLTIPAGSTDASFFYSDTTDGSPIVTASAPGRTTAQQVETIVPVTPPPVVTPPKPKPPALRVIKVAYTVKNGKLRVALTTVDPRRIGVAHASLRFALKRNGRWFAAASAQTGARGVAVHTRAKIKPGCYSVNVVRAKKSGFAWNRVTPKNGFCVKRPVRARSA
jgi:hypothetical protein